MKLFTLFIAILIVAVATLVSANHFSIEEEQQQFAKFEKLLNSPDYSAARNLTAGSLPGCLTMSSCRICGNYCGPGWCGKTYISESSCVATGKWGMGPASGSSQCVDGCCRTHDHCCGAGTDRSACNKNIVACIDRGNCGGICSFAVKTALKLVSHFCCGSRCPSYSADEHGNFVPMQLAGKRFCHKDSDLSVAFSADAEKPNSPASDIYNFNVKISTGKNSNEETIRASLHQMTNRVLLGSVPVAGGEEILVHKVPAAIQAENSFAASMASKDGAKIWYFPETEELYVRHMNVDGQQEEFETLSKC